jgi:hypothetical protein
MDRHYNKIKEEKKSKAIAALSNTHHFGDNCLMPDLMSTLIAIKATHGMIRK